MSRSWAFLLAILGLAGCNDDGGAAAPADEPAPAPPAEQVVGFSEAGTLLAGAGNTSPVNPQGCDTLQREGVDVNRHPWEVPGDIAGAQADVLGVSVAMTIDDPSLLDADLYLESPSGEVLGSSVAFNAMAGPSETVEVDGSLDPGTYTVVVRACLGSGSYTLAGEARLREAVPEPSASNGTSTA